MGDHAIPHALLNHQHRRHPHRMLTAATTLFRTVLKKVLEPTLIRLTAENIGTVTEQATDITFSVPMECCSPRNTEVLAIGRCQLIAGIARFVTIVTMIVNPIMGENKS